VVVTTLVIPIINTVSLCTLVADGSREDEWWRVGMHTVSVTGFLLGGIGGYFAFRVSGS